MKRVPLLLTLLTVLTLTSCLPQFVGPNPLDVTVTGAHEAVVTLTEVDPVFNVAVYLGGLEAAHSDTLHCEPFEKGWSCELEERVEPPVRLTVTVAAVNPRDVTASAWYSVPGARDRIARAAPD